MTGLSFVSFTVSVTVTMFETSAPSFALYWNESVPKKFERGV